MPPIRTHSRSHHPSTSSNPPSSHPHPFSLSSTSPTKPPTTNQIPRRRNGTLSSCEPCRKGRLACDHATPHCGRCVKRKMARGKLRLEDCVYLVAPVTGLRNRGRENGEGVEVGGESSHTSVLSRLAVATQPPLDKTKAVDESAPDPEQEEEGPARTGQWLPRFKADDLNPSKKVHINYPRRYWRPTSFGAVYEEFNDNEGDEVGDSVTLGETNGDLNEVHNRRGGGDAQGNENKFGDMLRIGEQEQRGLNELQFSLLGSFHPTSYTIRLELIHKALFNLPTLETCNRFKLRYLPSHDRSVLLRLFYPMRYSETAHAERNGCSNPGVREGING